MTAERGHEFNLDVNPSAPRERARPSSDRPFNILILGDFSGSVARRDADTGRPRGRRPIEVDRDNIDKVIAALRPAMHFHLGGDDGRDDTPKISVTVQSLEDFHPDRLVANVSILRSLAELREEAREGRYTAALFPAAPEDTPRPPAGRAGDSLLDQIVDGSAGPPRPNAVPPRRASAPGEDEPIEGDLHGFIRRVLEPHVVAEADPRATALAGKIEEALASTLRLVLHHPAFQALESTWRGVSFLVHRLETSATLKVFLVDLSRDDLIADLNPGREIDDSSVWRLVRDGAHAGPSTPFSVVAGLYTFDESAEDLAALTRMAAIARRENVSFLAGAAPSLGGVDSFAIQPEPEDLHPVSAAAWQTLRNSDAARNIGLALPRFILRAPYDPREEPCEALAFQEMDSPPTHGDYLWGNPALLCALLLGQAFEQDGWQMRPGSVSEVGGLPLHIYAASGAKEGKPCAESLLPDRVATRMMEAGVMTILSQKGGDSVRLARFQSISEPLRALVGDWGVE